MTLVTLAFVTFVACSSGPSSPAPIAAPTSSDASPPPLARPDAAPTALPITDEVRATIATLCTGKCNGRMAKVTVYRDARGTIARLMYSGDLRTCSHPPTSFHAPDGGETGAIGTNPTDAEDQAHRAAVVDAQLAGLTASNVLYCSDAR